MNEDPPRTMRCIVATEPGGAEMLRVMERPVPEPAEGEVLVRVAAAGVNRVDITQRLGSYAIPPGFTDLMGLEVAGTVAAIGDGVTAWSLGDRVCALTPGGGYAEYCPVDARHCLPIPQGLGEVEAASLPETYFTVWTNVFDRCALQPGETFLVHGGTSGIGVAAIQMAHHLGSRVLATAGSAEKCRACRELGADRAIDYRSEDFVAAVKEFTGGTGVDVILDMVAGDYTARNIEALALDGRLVHIAFMAGSEVTINLRPLMAKRLIVTGSALRPMTGDQKAAIAETLKARVWPLIEGGAIRPVIHAVFPFDQAAEAHRLMESSAHIGKIMLTP